jgi:valyl-tRNA synthetase
LLSCAAAGNDIIFDAPIDPETKQVRNESKLCEQGRNFCNKLWNVTRLLKGLTVADHPQSELNRLAVAWLQNRFDSVLTQVEADFAQYRLSDVVMALYKFIWDDFCSWHIEVIKPAQGESIDRITYEATIGLFEKMMVILHPFMPFITEEVWHQLRRRSKAEDCIMSSYPQAGTFDKTLIAQVEKAMDLTTKIRETRNSNGISPKEELRLYVEDGEGAKALYTQPGLAAMIQKMANLGDLTFTKAEPPSSISFLSGREKYYLEINIVIDKDAERERILKELEYHRGFVAGVIKKLGNERFVSGAPAHVVDLERKKLSDGEEKIRLLEQTLEKL